MGGKLTNEENENLTCWDMEYGKKEIPKKVQNEKHTLQDMDCGEKTENREKFDTHTVGTGIWQENRQTRKMRNSPCRI